MCLGGQWGALGCWIPTHSKRVPEDVACCLILLPSDEESVPLKPEQKKNPKSSGSYNMKNI